MTMTVSLSPDQSAARDAVMSWYSDRRKMTLTLGGYAGTGKTTTLAAIAAALAIYGGDSLSYAPDYHRVLTPP